MLPNIPNLLFQVRRLPTTSTDNLKCWKSTRTTKVIAQAQLVLRQTKLILVRESVGTKFFFFCISSFSSSAHDAFGFCAALSSLFFFLLLSSSSLFFSLLLSSLFFSLLSRHCPSFYWASIGFLTHNVVARFQWRQSRVQVRFKCYLLFVVWTTLYLNIFTYMNF